MWGYTNRAEMLFLQFDYTRKFQKEMYIMWRIFLPLPQAFLES